MVLAVTIGAVNQTSKLREGSATLKFNTFDATFVDVATMPVVGNAVALTTPTWAGTVVSVKKRTGPRPGHTYVTVSATNTDTAGASAGPFGLSDTPNGSTTFGYTNLEVETTHNIDGTDLTKGSLVLFTTGLWPAMTFNLTNADLGYSATNFSVTDVTVTWIKGVPFYALTFGDPLVTMSVWLNSESAGILPITRTKITDGEVTTPKLAANAVTADKLEAQLVLSTLIVTPALTGARLELDGDGFRDFDSGDDLLVKIPTNGDPVLVNGELVATSLVSTATAELRGTNLLASSSVTRLGAGVEAPTTGPTLVEGVATLSTLAPGSSYHTSIWGSEYDTSDNTIYGLIYDSTFTTVYIAQFTASTGALVRAVATGDNHVDVSSDITLNATHVFVRYNTDIIRKYLKTTLALVSSSAAIAINSATGGLFYDSSAAKVVLADTASAGASAQARFRLVDPTALTVSSTVTGTGLALGTGSSVRIKGGYDDATNYWIAVDPAGTNVWTAYAWNESTGANVANRDFGTVGTVSSYLHSGLLFDGTQFLGVNQFAVSQFTSWDWTTASAKYWVGYSWRDGTGTTHETELGPRSSITMHRRTRLQVNTAAIPTGGVDDPDSVRIYMLPNASAPSPGAFKLQVTDALTSRYLTTYASGGAADPTSNSFPAATPAELKSATTGWHLYGDGTTSFLVNSSTGFTISGGGSATYTGKLCEWISLGRLVVFALSFTVNAGGSGGTTVTIASTTMPAASTNSGTTTFIGDRSTATPVRLAWRAVNATNMDFASILRLDTGATITGADLSATAVYTVTGAYIST